MLAFPETDSNTDGELLPHTMRIRMVKLPKNQIFHSQCWKHIEAESKAKPGVTFEVRAISADVLVPLLEKIGPPLSAFAVLRDDGESVVAGVERWLCNNSSSQLVTWNVAMTGK